MTHDRAAALLGSVFCRSTPQGLIFRRASLYDALAAFLTLGRAGAVRRAALDLARVGSGDRFLDVGCGTGTLALEANRRAGPDGIVCGVDAGAEMVGIAARKAIRQGLKVSFEVGTAQDLPYRDGDFDVVVSTLMLHHLPREGRPRAIREMGRVLRPGGRLLLVDLARPGGPWSALDPTRLIHRREDHAVTEEAEVEVRRAGLGEILTGSLVLRSIRYVRATKQVRPSGTVRRSQEERRHPSGVPATRTPRRA